jgi:hypothetical protein
MLKNIRRCGTCTRVWKLRRSLSDFPFESNCVTMPMAESGRTPFTGVLMSTARN